MSDNGTEKKDKIVLSITMEKGKGIGVEGPGNGKYYDEALCFHIMRKAGQFIEAHNARSAMEDKPVIHKPGFKDRVRGAFGK